MGTGPLNLKPQKTRLHSKRPLLLRLLVTALCTAIILTGGLYGLKKGIEARPKKITQAVPQPQESPALPKPRPAIFDSRAAAPGNASGSVLLVKKGTDPAENSRRVTRPAARVAGKPRLSYASGEGMFLKPSHSAPKLKMPGARPVSVALEKRYSGIDPESEMLRARERAKAAAAEAAKKQLFKEKLQLCGIITLLALPVMLFGSRILRALRLMNNPEDTHWTLK